MNLSETLGVPFVAATSSKLFATPVHFKLLRRSEYVGSRSLFHHAFLRALLETTLGRSDLRHSAHIGWGIQSIGHYWPDEIQRPFDVEGVPHGNCNQRVSQKPIDNLNDSAQS